MRLTNLQSQSQAFDWIAFQLSNSYLKLTTKYNINDQFVLQDTLSTMSYPVDPKAIMRELVMWAKHIPYFTKLHINDQKLLLKHGEKLNELLP